jgi:hypothetical protein
MRTIIAGAPPRWYLELSLKLGIWFGSARFLDVAAKGSRVLSAPARQWMPGQRRSLRSRLRTLRRPILLRRLGLQ